MRIKEILNEKGMGINDLAERLGVHRVTLCKTITQHDSNPTVKTLRKLADILGCDVMDFFKDEATHQDAATKAEPGFTAMFDHNGNLYKANTIEQAENILKAIKEK